MWVVMLYNALVHSTGWPLLIQLQMGRKKEIDLKSIKVNAIFWNLLMVVTI